MLENLLVTFSGLMGLFTIGLIVWRYKTNRLANIYLILIFLIVSTRLTLLGFYSLNLVSENFIAMLLHNYNNIMIVVVPCAYLYFKNLITDVKLIKQKDYYHFLIPILFEFTDLFIKVFPVKIEFIKYYYYLFFTVYTLGYFIAMFRLLNRYVWNRNGEINLAIKQNKLIKKWTKYLFTFMFLVAIRLIISLFLEINNHNFSFGTSYIWISALIWIVLFFKILLSPEILYGYHYLFQKIDEHKKTENALISFWEVNSISEITNIQDRQLKEKIESNIVEYMKEIDRFSFDSEHYRYPKLTLNDLASKLKIPKSHISFLFKYHSKISFSEYKKIVRIHDGLELIKADYLKNNTFDSLSQKIGFASYNTFFVSFKDVTGVTPQEYLFRTMKNKFSN